MSANPRITHNPYGYTGREMDTLRLYYYRARYYSPILHRFLTPDPIEHASGDWNWYRYVGNDPVNRVDPSGLESTGFDPLFGAPTDIMQPLYDWWDNVFGPKPPSTFDKTMTGLKHGFKEFAKGPSLIKDKYIPEGIKAYKKAPKALQMCVDASLTIVEYGGTAGLPKYLSVPYDVYSGANFNTMPTSKAGWIGNLLGGTTAE